MIVGKFQIRALGAAAVALFSVGAAEAALTEQQVNTALGSVPGVAWSVEGPDADAWTVTGSGTAVSVASALRNESYGLTATVTGPGVLELASSRTSSVFSGGIQVDGQYRSGYTFVGTNRVMVGAGTHTVTWRVTHSAHNDDAVSASFSGVKWEPYSVLPLSVGAAGGSVGLSGTWVGQDRWHHGDGAAAFSGDADAGSQVLTGNFTGPGILVYEISQRSGTVTFSLNGGAAAAMSSSAGEWRREWYPAGSGAHVATWTAAGQVTEAAIDEVRVVPEVDLATALDTPGRVWTSTTSGVWRAFGVPMADAVGGHSVLLDSKVTVSSDFAGPGILKVRYRSGSPEGYIGGTKLTSTPRDTTAEWKTKVISVPAGGGTVMLDSTLDTEIDGVEWEPLPTTVAETLGLPLATTTTGGEGTWTIVPEISVAKHVAKTSLTPSVPTAWVNSTLTGPARVTLYFETNQNGVLDFLLDGVEVWDSQVPANGRVTLEIPAGQHVLRAEARATTATAGSPFNVGLREMKVVPVETVGMIPETLGYPAKWVSIGEWERVESPNYDGDGSLRPLVPQGTAPSTTLTRWLGTTVTGPGYFSFQRKQPLGYPVLTLYGDTLSGGVPVTLAAEDWAVHRHWFPAGTHKVQLKVEGSAVGMSNFYLDEVNFEPSGTGLLSQVSIGASLVMQDDASHPWMVVKAPDAPAVAVSPLLDDTENSLNSGISATVTGPGLLKFQWMKQGRRLVDGWLEMDGVRLPVTGDGRKSIEIPAGTHQLAWKVSTTDRGSWLEVSEVDWQPWPESSLASALDAPESVTWATGGDTTFTGRPDANAKNGTAAYVWLQAGQTSWIEGTMSGPGVFDFWLRPGASNGYSLQYYSNWVMTVDGTEVLRSGQQAWDPIWVRGAGQHKVRLTFTNGTNKTVSGSMDEVTWMPLVQRTLDASWTSNVSEAVNGYEGPGGNGFVLRTSYFTPSWIEKTVTGPCEVSWDSLAVGGESLIGGEPTVTVDGKGAVLMERAHGDYRNTLVIPAGTHVIRWSNVTEHGNGYGFLPPEEKQGSYWRITDPVVTPGVSGFAEALDAPDSCWLVQGVDGGVVTGTEAMDGVDAYGSGMDGRFHYLNLSASAQRLRGGIRYETDESWRDMRMVVEAANAQPWGGIFGFAPAAEYSLDAFTAETLTEVAVHEALELADGEVISDWRGIASAADAWDGVDGAWSLVDDLYDRPTVSLTVNGASRVRFRWKQAGESSLVLRLNGAPLPVAPPGSAWAEVSIEVGNGVNRIDWEHAGREETTLFNTGEAWLDAVSIEPLSSWDLTAAAVEGSGLALTADAPSDPSLQWKPASFQLPGGGTVTGARGATSASVMRASVTGPAVVSFRGACFADNATETMMGGRNARGGKSVLVVGGGTWGNGDGGLDAGYELTAMVGTKVVGSVPYRDGVEWSDVTFAVPEGTHEVTWRVSKLRTTSVPGSFTRETTPWIDLQGWVSGMRLESQRVCFDRWAESLPEGKRGLDDDADGDGVSNLMEYAFRSSSADASSVPPTVTGRKGSVLLPFVGLYPSLGDGYWVIGSEGPVWVPSEPATTSPSPVSSYEVMVPYLSPLVDGKLEMSADMETWEEFPVEWLESKPYVAPGSLGGANHTDTHQALSVPLYEGDTAKFFRVRVAVPE